LIINDVHHKTIKKKGKEREKKNVYHIALATLTLNYIIFKNVEVFKNYLSHKKHFLKENIEYIEIFYSLKSNSQNKFIFNIHVLKLPKLQGALLY
jgi:hypothetical protein